MKVATGAQRSQKCRVLAGMTKLCGFKTYIIV